MSILRYPETCQLCQKKLNGAAEIELERDGEEYFLNIRQTALLDWGICPRCKQIVCFASCWDKERGYCKSCPSFDTVGNCPECNRVLTGVVEIIKTETNGIPTIRFQETADRNWIQCDACNLVICKVCCQNAGSGYCNACLARIGQVPPEALTTIEKSLNCSKQFEPFKLNANLPNQK